ncbi:MAG: PilZ domain-containing protein, partial [Deltaproteobacteria bacterium]|nr:PilZ domain-containing protein [Deltaproteobacteria bacterium]
ILGTVTAPTPLVFLDYPHTIEAVNLRKEKRVRCYIPAAAQKSNTLTKGLLTDINLTGCRFNYHHAGDAAQDLSIDTDLLRLSSPLLGIGETLQCSGTVRNLTHTHNTASAGIQFQDIPTEVVEKIRVYMQNVSEHEGEDAQNV